MRTTSEQSTGYSKAALSKWARRCNEWSEGKTPSDLAVVADTAASTKARDVFAFFISGAKERAPAAAMHLIQTLSAK